MDGVHFNMKKNILSIGMAVAFLFFACVNNICGGLTMEFKPKKFSKVPINFNDLNVCSPSATGKGPSWEGIEINVPEQILVPKGSAKPIIPVCGYYCIETIKLMTLQPFKIIIIYHKTNTTFSGLLIDNDPSPEAPDPFEDESDEIDIEEIKGMYNCGYFNPNILDYVRTPPLQSGEYEVFIERGNIKSNSERLQLIIQK